MTLLIAIDMARLNDVHDTLVVINDAFKSICNAF